MKYYINDWSLIWVQTQSILKFVTREYYLNY
jgi:hypothetical protein